MKTNSRRRYKKLLKDNAKLKSLLKKQGELLRHYRVINKAVFEHSPVGITIRRSSGELVSYNRTWKKIWDLSEIIIRRYEKKCRNMKAYERYPYLKDAAPRVQQVFDKGGEIFLPEIHVTNPETHFDKWIAQHYYAMNDATGKVEYVVTITQDITAQKNILLALEQSEEKFRTIVNNLTIAVYRSSASPPGKLLQVNPAFVKMFGYRSTNQVLKIPVERFYKSPVERRALVKELKSKGEVKNKEIQLQQRDGKVFWASIYARATLDEKGNIKWIDGVIEDITGRKKTEEKLHALSLTDELTGLYNRRGFFTLAEYQIKIAQTTKKAMLLLFMDMDNLKDINDEFGHPMGDQALLQTTRILKKIFRESDIIARIGGDEFVIMTIELQKAKGGIFSDRLEKSLEEFNRSGKLPFKIALSIGWSYFDPANPLTITQLLKQADHMMYLNKQRKKKIF